MLSSICSSHEHQRPDAWEPNPLFKFDCKKDAEYKGYIEEVKPDGTEVAKIVPKDER